MDTGRSTAEASSSSSTCVPNVRSSGYAGMTLSETQKLSTGPTFPVYRQDIAKRRNSLFGHVVMTRRQPTAHYHRSQQQELAPALVLVGGDGHGRPRHSWIQQICDGTPFSIRAEWSKARRRGHSGLTQLTDLCCLRCQNI